MAVATVTTEPDGPLTQSHRDEVTSAQDRARKIHKAAALAGFNGWTTGIIAICSAPFALFSLAGLVVTVGLSFVTYNEFRGRRQLLRFERNAATFLGWNQIGFLVLIVGYCLWMLFVGLTADAPFAAEMKANPQLIAALGSDVEFDQLYRLLVVAVYGAVIGLSAVFQGLNALYYFTREKYVEAYVQQTPNWVHDLQCLTSSATPAIGWPL